MLRLVASNERPVDAISMWREGEANYRKPSPKLLCRIIGCRPKKGTVRQFTVMSYWGDMFECKCCGRTIAIDAWD